MDARLFESPQFRRIFENREIFRNVYPIVTTAAIENRRIFGVSGKVIALDFDHESEISKCIGDLPSAERSID